MTDSYESTCSARLQSFINDGLSKPLRTTFGRFTCETLGIAFLHTLYVFCAV
jgi:hypothetical protein